MHSSNELISYIPPRSVQEALEYAQAYPQTATLYLKGASQTVSHADGTRASYSLDVPAPHESYYSKHVEDETGQPVTSEWLSVAAHFDKTTVYETKPYREEIEETVPARSILGRLAGRTEVRTSFIKSERTIPVSRYKLSTTPRTATDSREVPAISFFYTTSATNTTLQQRVGQQYPESDISGAFGRNKILDLVSILPQDLAKDFWQDSVKDPTAVRYYALSLAAGIVPHRSEMAGYALTPQYDKAPANWPMAFVNYANRPHDPNVSGFHFQPSRQFVVAGNMHPVVKSARGLLLGHER